MKGNINAARRLRRDHTDAERVLWFRLRDRRLEGWKFRRQAPIDRFIVDFVCADAKVIVELDGGQHATRLQSDAERTAILVSRFRSSPHLAARSRANFGIERTLASIASSVVLDLKSLRRGCRKNGRDFKSTTLESMGYLVLRFWNNDVLANTDGVLETIVHTLTRQAAFPLTPSLSPLGRGGAA